MIRFLSFCFVFLTGISVHASNQDVPKLQLSASASISKPADELHMKIGVITLGDTAEEALKENSRKMQDVITSIRTAGLNQDDYETSHFSINPTYSPYPQNPSPNWKQSIIGYEVTNSILVHTAQLDIAGKIIDLANRAGANSISDIRFGLHSSRTYWTEALSAAGANAVSDAQAIADATGVQLVRVLSISLNHTQVHSPQLSLPSMARMGGDAAPPIEPGEVTIEANVTLVYEIR